MPGVRLVISNQICELRRMSQWLSDSAIAAGTPQDLVYALEYCANEAIYNIISYAFDDGQRHEITLELSKTAEGASLIIRDDGKPFNPLEAPAVKQPEGLDDMKIGGLGVHLIRQLTWRCNYQREGAINVLRLEARPGSRTGMHSRGPDRRKAGRGALQAGLAADLRKSNDRRRNGFISRLNLFAAIPYEAVETVLEDCVTRDVAAGAVLLEPGQGNDSIHVLVSGRLRIHLDQPDSADYIPIEEGGCFGELSIIDGLPVSAYIVADQPSRVMMIHENVFWERLIPHRGVARNLLKVLSERMRVNRDMILERLKDRLVLELLQKELAIAHDLQISMLPVGSRLFTERTDVQAYAIMEPARNVGGDFYDAFFAAPKRLFVAVGDVAGKGVPAAMFMARTITQMRMEAVTGRAPSAVLEAVNRALCESNDAGMFVTLFCGVLETETGQFTFANAGHNPPVLIKTDGQHEYLKLKKGLVAGMMESSRYPIDTIQLASGQSLLLYTDGVTEAMNPRKEFYSESQLLAALRHRTWDNPRIVVDTVRASIARFVQDSPQADDITMLALRYCGGAAGGTVPV